MAETLNKAEIVNMINIAVAGEREKLQHNYCPTVLGCHKGKEIDSYIRGPIASKLSDMRFHVEAIEKDFPKIKQEVNEMNGKLKLIERRNEENKKTFRMLTVTVISGLVIGIIQQFFVIITNVEAKNADVTTQQYNQERMEKKLEKLLEALEAQVKKK